VGTEPARLQKRLDNALGTRVHAAREGHGVPAMDPCADLSALGATPPELLVRSHPLVCAATVCPRGRNSVVCAPQPRPLASKFVARHARRPPTPHDFGMSTCTVVFPPPTGGRFK